MNCFQDFVTAAASMSTLKVTTNPVDGHVMFARIDASIFLRKRIFCPEKGSRAERRHRKKRSDTDRGVEPAWERARC
jgi:hypothetical protein